MIVQTKKSLRIAEYWADEPAEPVDADLIRWFQQPQVRAGMFCREFFTILIDLTSDEEQVFAAIEKDTRYEIRRAQTKDDLTCELINPDADTLRIFCDYYDQFAKQKAQAPLDRAWLKLLLDVEAMRLSRSHHAGGETLVWHSYHWMNRRATLLNSASSLRGTDDAARRQMIGRANRLLHWRDMLSFKAAGAEAYDFGGWYEGKTNEQRLKINHFKEEFGGEIVKNYICEHAVTWKGKLFLTARRLMLGNAI